MGFIIQGGGARKVYIVNSASIEARGIEGGAAEPVYVINLADLDRDLVIEAGQINSEGADLATVLTADGSGGASFINYTFWRDELQSLIGQRLESPSSDIVQNNAEGSLTFKTTARNTDYVTMNLQLNHDWIIGTVIDPHLHWWQTTAATPNWMIQWRWQINGQAKDTSWTSQKWSSNFATWTAGTLVQITELGLITPPVGAGLSDILQIRLIRDYTNVSGLFTGNDPVAANVDAVNFDCHIQISTPGSRQEYVK